MAETIETPPDRSWVAFTLRPTARFHDGSPMTVEDVRWTFETLRTKGHPLLPVVLRPVTSAEQTGPRTVRFAFKAGDNRELPVIVGQLPVLSKAYWAGRDFTKTTLEPPLGSGPYRVESLEPGRSITYRRVKDYWGAALPVNVGRFNFDTIRYDYYRDDSTVALEAFKGGAFDFRQEASSKNWATAYHDAGGAGRRITEGGDYQRGADRHAGVRLQHAPGDLPRPPRARGAGRGLRLRVEQRPPLLRRLRAHGESLLQLRAGLARTAGAAELAVLEPLRGRIPDEVFTREYHPPSTERAGCARISCARCRAPKSSRLGRARPEAGERRDRDSRWPSRSCSTIRTSSASRLPFVKNLERAR